MPAWQNIPLELRASPQWVAWKSVTRPDQPKPAKIPVDAKTGRNASTTDPSTWANAETAFAFAAEHGLGVGFVLTHNDPFCCIDLDATEDAAVQANQRAILEVANGAYVESSPSGNGFHIWAKHSATVTKPRAIPGVECYTAERFITVTGEEARGALRELSPGLAERLAPCFAPQPELVIPRGPLRASDTEVLNKARERFGQSFDALWLGERGEEYPSPSEADFYLVFMLAWCSGDDVQVGHLFLESELGRRDKARRRDYLPTTIQNARLAVARELEAIAHGRRVADALLARWKSGIRNRVAGLLVRWEDFGSVASPLRLVKGLLGSGDLSVAYGMPGTGKSFGVLDIGVAVATGSPWMGHPTSKGLVIYAAGEGVSGLRYRRTAILRARGFATPSLVFLPVALDTPDDVETFLLVLDEAAGMYREPPALLILDTLSRYFGDGDENQAKDMGRFIAALDRLRRKYPAMHVMVVHHAGKDPTRGMRGSSALKGAADTVIEFTKTTTREGERRYLATVQKQKDGPEGLAFPFRLRSVEVGRDEEGNPITSCVVESEERSFKGVANSHSTPTGHVASAIRTLHELGGPGHEVPYEAGYLARWYAADPNAKRDTVLRAASRALKELRDEYGAVSWQPGEKSVRILAPFSDLCERLEQR